MLEAQPATAQHPDAAQKSNASRDRRRRAAAAAKAKPAAKMVRTEGAAAPPDAAERAKCPSCGKNCLFARGDASCCPEYKQHNGVRLDHEDAAPKPIEEVRRLNADDASVVVTGKKQRQPGDGSCNYHSLSAELRRLPGFS